MAWYENGYVMISTPGGNHRNKRGCMKLSIIIAELVWGKLLPPGAVVHHVNGIKDDDRPKNLVICENQAYHQLLHERIKAQEATGDPHKRRCKTCKAWDDPEKLKKTGESWVHPVCDKEYHRGYYLNNRDKFLNRAQEQRERRKQNG
jgi:hypothetical protein